LTTATLSIPRAELAATSSQNLVFFGGGWNGIVDAPVYYDRVDIYNTLNGSWSTATLSQSRCCLAATSVGNLVLFGGGFNSTGYSKLQKCCPQNFWLLSKKTQSLKFKNFWLLSTKLQL
jgi:hypothetical protein